MWACCNGWKVVIGPKSKKDICMLSLEHVCVISPLIDSDTTADSVIPIPLPGLGMSILPSSAGRLWNLYCALDMRLSVVLFRVSVIFGISRQLYGKNVAC